jgi:hypothetical protein
MTAAIIARPGGGTQAGGRPITGQKQNHMAPITDSKGDKTPTNGIQMRNLLAR